MYFYNPSPILFKISKYIDVGRRDQHLPIYLNIQYVQLFCNIILRLFHCAVPTLQSKGITNHKNVLMFADSK